MKDFKHLEIAIATIQYYNDMDFDDFVDKYERYTGLIISDDIIEFWRFTGLNNIDFFKMQPIDIKTINEDDVQTTNITKNK